MRIDVNFLCALTVLCAGGDLCDDDRVMDGGRDCFETRDARVCCEFLLSSGLRVWIYQFIIRRAIYGDRGAIRFLHLVKSKMGGKAWLNVAIYEISWAGRNVIRCKSHANPRKETLLVEFENEGIARVNALPSIRRFSSVSRFRACCVLCVMLLIDGRVVCLS